MTALKKDIYQSLENQTECTDMFLGDETGACISWSGPSLSRETSTGDATETFISGVFEPSVQRKH